jgi:cytochrome c peroxidase
MDLVSLPASKSPQSTPHSHSVTAAPRRAARVGLLASLLVAVGCGSPASGPAAPIAQSLTRFPYDAFPIPLDNQPTPQRIELGRLLFFDPILSGNQRVSCGSCHHPDAAMGDGLPVGAALGDPAGGELPRSSPTIFNARFQHSQFWDGRAGSLEDLAAQPIANQRELASSVPQVLTRLQGVPEYVQRFSDAYGALDEHALRRAIAAFVREVTANDAPVDRYLAGDEAALSARARAGFGLFFGKARCSRCHYLPLFAGTEGPSFSTTEFRVTGVPERGSAPLRMTTDRGRAAVEGQSDPVFEHAFKAPTLRNIAQTAPYMHNGALKTLEEVVDFYNTVTSPSLRGYEVPGLDFVLALGPIDLSADEKGALVAFLREGLTDLSKMPQVPAAVPSGLVPVGTLPPKQ